MSYYDDNFGTWDMQDEGAEEFYHHVQRTSVWKYCVDCGQRVKIMPHYECCNSCAEVRERGGY